MFHNFLRNQFRQKASAHRSRSPHIDVLPTDSGQPYAGEWTNCLKIGKSVTRKVVEMFTDRHLANENDSSLHINVNWNNSNIEQRTYDIDNNFTDSHWNLQKADGQRVRLIILYSFIPEQFTVIGPPSFIWGGGAKKLRNTFQRLRSEEFSAWGVFVYIFQSFPKFSEFFRIKFPEVVFRSFPK